MKLTEQEIKNIVQSGEGYNTEFKISVPSKVRDLAGEVCAFANAAGGTLLLGVNDNNEIIGLEINNTKRSAIQDVLSQLNPHLYCDFYFVYVDGKQIGVIDIPSGLQKPYTISGAIYIRQGANSQKITSVEQMRDFFQQSDRIYFDEGSCKDFSYENDFDTELFNEFRAIAGISAHIENKQIIKNLRLCDTENNYKNGSVLFFGKLPEQFFDTAVIHCVAFDGTTKVEIIDDKVFGGTLISQYREAMQWIKKKLNIRYIINGGGPRKEQWEIPESVFKESLINALSHRDYYDRGGKIIVELFDDRVEITNPGGLVSAINPDEFGFKSHSRNPLIFGLFNRIQMVEQVGSGIGRIFNDLKEAGLAKPIYKTDGLFTVIFHRIVQNVDIVIRGKSNTVLNLILENKKISVNGLVERVGSRLVERVGSKLVENQYKILLLMEENSKITKETLANALGISSTAIDKNILKLKNIGLLERVGTNKSGYWKLLFIQ